MFQRAAIGCLAALCAVLFFYRLGDRGLTSSHEARAAQNAHVVLEDGDWALPRLFDRRVELQKPPLYYWLVALLGLMGGGVDAWAVRLPAALSAAGCVAFLYFLGCRCGRRRAGLLAAVILATCVHFTWLARVGRIDMALTLMITLTLGGFLLGHNQLHEGRRWRHWFLLAYFAMAVGVLLKGPIAIVMPMLAAAACGVQIRRQTGSLPWKELRTLWWGVPLVLLLAGPWFVWANYETGNRLWQVFFWYHNVERGLTGTSASHPWWFYAPRLLIDLFPWCLLLPFALWASRRAEADPIARFGMVWFATILGLLSLMSFKRADYLVPGYPGFALWLGCLVDRRMRESSGLRLRQATAALAGLVVVGWSTYLAWIEPAQGDGHAYRHFAQEIRRRTNWPVIFFRTEAHEVAFHVGRPLDTILEWENLQVWANQPEPVYFVMSEDSAADWAKHLKRGKLEEVLRTTDLSPGPHDRPLVLMRSVVRTESRDQRITRARQWAE